MTTKKKTPSFLSSAYMPTKKKLQVFVSSTYVDLKFERQAAVEAILSAEHIPAGMELFAAGSDSQFETIKRWIDESDVYMLILGGRYGSVEPKKSLSYTELEYDYAVSKEKPLFAVVITDTLLDQKVKIDGRAVIENEHQAELKRFREKVLKRMVKFFDKSEDIQLAVHTTLADFIKRYEFKGWIPGDEPTETLISQFKQYTFKYATEQFDRLAVIGAREEMNKVGQYPTILEYLNTIAEPHVRKKAEQNLLEYVYVFNRLGAGIYNGALDRETIYDIWAPDFFRNHWVKYESLLEEKRNNNKLHKAYRYFDWLAKEDFNKYKDTFPRIYPHNVPSTK